MKIAILILGFLMAGCSVHYTTPLCQPNLKSDVPFFSGSYRVYMMDQDFNMMTVGYKLQRIDVGTYKGEPRGQPPQEPIFQTCQIGTRIFMETELKRTDGTKVGWSGYMLKDFNDGVAVTPIVFDTQQLGAAQIPFQYIPKEECEENSSSMAKAYGATSNWNRIKTMASNKDKCLIIDNAKVDSDKMGLLAFPFSFSLNLYK